MSLDGSSSKNNVTNSSKTTPANEPKRSAGDILSVLRRPIVQGNVEPMVEDSVELLVSDNHSDTRNHIHAKDCNSSAEDEFRERTSDHDCSMKTIKSEAVKILTAEKCAVYEFEEDLQENSSFYLRTGATDSIKPVVNAECTDHFKLRLSSSTTEAHKLFTPAIDPVGQAAIASTFTVSNVKVKLENTVEIDSLPEITTETPGAVKVSSSIFPKQHEDNEGNSSRCDKGATSIAGVASSDRTSHDYSDVEENILKQAFLTKERDEFPSFDLGFEFD